MEHSVIEKSIEINVPVSEEHGQETGAWRGTIT
jgi:hypothetical protein